MMMNAKRQKLLQKLEEDKRRADELFEKKYPTPVELQRTLDIRGTRGPALMKKEM